METGLLGRRLRAARLDPALDEEVEADTETNMPRLVKIAALIGAAWFAYDYFVVRGGGEAFRFPEPRPIPTGARMEREPGGGLNPFVTESDHAAPPQRPRVPQIPGSR